MTNTNATNFRQNIFEYLKQAALYNDVVNVNTKDGNVVVISEDEYNGILETLYLQSIPGMTESILTGKNEPIEECAEYIPGEEW